MTLLLKKLILLTTILMVFACDDNTQNINQNNQVPNTRVDFTFSSPNLSNTLGFYVEENRGVKGVVVYKTASERLVAYDLACPYISQSTCSNAMNISNLPTSLNCKDCTDDDILFFLENPVNTVNGKSYELQQYKVTQIDQFQYRVSNF